MFHTFFSVIILIKNDLVHFTIIKLRKLQQHHGPRTSVQIIVIQSVTDIAIKMTFKYSYDSTSSSRFLK